MEPGRSATPVGCITPNWRESASLRPGRSVPSLKRPTDNEISRTIVNKGSIWRPRRTKLRHDGRQSHDRFLASHLTRDGARANLHLMISSKTYFQRLLIPGFGTPTLRRSLYIRFYISDTSGFADGPVGISGVFSSNYFSSTDYFQVYLFVEFLGGTIRFEFLDKRDFWTTPTVERYQEQFVGAAAESNHRIGPTGCWPSSFWRVRYTWCCGARGKLQRLYGVGDGRSRREGMDGG